MLLYGANIVLEKDVEHGRNIARERLAMINDSIDAVCKSRNYLLRAVENSKNKVKLVILLNNHLIIHYMLH